jgi:uncharacterized protein HemY
LTETMRRPFLAVAADASKSTLARLTTSKRDRLKYSDKLTDMGQAVRAGRSREVLDIFAQLPESLRKEKSILIMRLMAARQIGENETLEAIEAIRAEYPNDPCLDLIMIEDCAMRKQYGKALAAIDNLDRAVGGDPYLDVRRGAMYMDEKKSAEAKKHYQKAIDAEPTLKLPYWSLVSLSLKEKDFAETCRLLDLVHDKLGVETRGVDQGPHYAEFVKSPEYREWIAKRQKK